MAEDAYRIELVHAWRMKRVDEAIDAVRDARRVLEEDIAYVLRSQHDIGGLGTGRLHWAPNPGDPSGD